MKKFLVVLLILSVAGGVFAQGEWSVGGRAEIGTILNFHNDLDEALIGGHAYNRYGWYGDINGEFDINYKRDGLDAYIMLNTAEWLAVGMTYDGGNYMFNAEVPFINMLGTGGLGYYGTPAWDPDDHTNEPGFFRANNLWRLWGWYKMLDEMVHMEAAFVSRDTNFWISDETVGEVFDDLGGFYGLEGWGFASVDGHNYFLVDFNFSGLSFGAMLPSVFNMPFGDGGKWGQGGGLVSYPPPDYDETAVPGYHPSMNWWASAVPFVDGVLKQMIIGAKFEMSPIEFAIQFNMANYGAYFGAKTSMGPVGFGLSFEGIFSDTMVWSDDADDFIDGPFTDETRAAFGASVDYNGGAFGAKLRIGYAVASVDWVDPVFGIVPSFWYNVLPDNLAFSLDAGFWFFTGDDSDVHWKFTPQLFWNFKGTGAGADYWWPNQTGFIIRYTMEKDTYNALDVTFKWNFF